MSRHLTAFALLSFLWGVSWGAVKVGLGALPPLQMAAWRYLLAAGLLFICTSDRAGALRDGRARRTVLTSLLVCTGTYGPMFWGMQHVSSGLAGVVNMALVPVLLFALALVTGEERPTWRHAIALLLGCFGLMLLFWTRLHGAEASLTGLFALIIGTSSSCLGLVLSRPLIGPVRPLTLVMTQSAIGAAGLLLLACLLEPFSVATLAPLASLRGYGSVLYLSVLSTIVGYTIYLVLVREWGTVRASLYAFVSPIVALLTGALLFGETVGSAEIAGAALLMVAAAVALTGRRHPPTVSLD
jgi:drug/metabolite transporter (DMT)-like permease